MEKQSRFRAIPESRAPSHSARDYVIDRNPYEIHTKAVLTPVACRAGMCQKERENARSRHHFSSVIKVTCTFIISCH